MLHALLDLVFAPVCLGCDRPIASGDAARLVCRVCRARLRVPDPPLCARCGAPARLTGVAPGASCRECAKWPPAIRAARAACLLKPPADRLVHELKYRGWRALAGPMAEAMARAALPEDSMREATVVVPVPTTRRRLRKRGYNQAEELARAYAFATGRRCLQLLVRGGDAGTQTSLQPLARAANVAGAFRLADDAAQHVVARHLLLVDDVMTTGATAGECAQVLVEQGARCVTVVTFARALA
ncbi:MAG TPA: ComF family protein [Longimicrobiales bacterium]